MLDAFFRLSKDTKTYETIFYCIAFKTLIVNNFYLLLSISMIFAMHNLPKILLAMSCMNLYDFVPLVNKDGSGCLLLVQRLREKSILLINNHLSKSRYLLKSCIGK